MFIFLLKLLGILALCIVGAFLVFLLILVLRTTITALRKGGNQDAGK